MIVAGFGFRSAASVDTLRTVLALAQAGRPPVTTLAAPADKIAPVEQLGREMGMPVLSVDPAALLSTATPTHAIKSYRTNHIGSVCEAAALAAAGPGARLLTTRHISPDRMATCAIAQGFAP